MSAKIFIDGESGTTGLGIRARLEALPDIELLSLPPDQRKDPEAKQAVMERADIVVLCLPDDAARETVAIAAAMGDKSPRILDASTAHRVEEGWTYGFPELAPGQAEAIAERKACRQPGLLRDRCDRAFAPACRQRPSACRFSGLDPCGVRLFGRRQDDDRRPMSAARRLPSKPMRLASNTSMCRK